MSQRWLAMAEHQSLQQTARGWIGAATGAVTLHAAGMTPVVIVSSGRQ